ncbi:hypothetical protein PHMEG_000819 [Phytophthora megakarya]|uniref:Uncharacterized protein n=1 Tax=Phytophthora megakarya TaxID=4795 RepID=A0A225X4H5_9STRA|nr:hypothetical protein PHMEG_000819 [Phytophthora megakarya]
MSEDRLHVLDVDVSVEASSRIGSQLQGGDNQCIAVCYQTGVIVIANGGFVDLYGVCNNSLHPFLFLHHISIRDHVSRLYSSNSGRCDDKELQIATATCISFPVPGFLLVGAFVEVPESEISGTDTSVDPIQVYFSFIEPIVGVDGKSIRHLQSFRPDMTPNSGSVVLLFEDSALFGVFSWKERFSDRLTCLAEMKQQMERLVVSDCSPDGRYVVVGDAGGRLSLVDFKCFKMDEYDASSSSEQLAGKRLKLGPCFRSGVITRDNPLERVRVVHTSVVSTSSACGVNCPYTSLRWWICGIRDQQKQFILAGKQDGSLNVRERVGSMKEKVDITRKCELTTRHSNSPKETRKQELQLN